MQQPRVGVGVLIVKGNKVLIGKRKGSHGSGEYALPGGHLEYQESFEECARREVAEETGISIREIHFVYTVNCIFDSGAHYVTIFMRAEVDEATEAQNLEPEKCEGWSWVSVEAIPEPTFLPLQKLLQSDVQII